MPFGNFSFWEIILLMVAVLLLFGAKRLPEIGASMGKGIREFKKSLTDVNRSLTEPEARESLPPSRSESEVARKDEERRPEPKRLI
jgi:sec-independent protein translocase protein TatA